MWPIKREREGWEVKNDAMNFLFFRVCLEIGFFVTGAGEFAGLLIVASGEKKDGIRVRSLGLGSVFFLFLDMVLHLCFWHGFCVCFCGWGFLLQCKYIDIVAFNGVLNLFFASVIPRTYALP